MDILGPGERRPLAISAAALALTATSVLPATAAPPEVIYDALGDSYAAGYGVAPERAHPNMLDGVMQIDLDDFAAVSGATVATMLADQLDALDADTDLVTVSIGGNDIPWTAVVLACAATDDANCQYWLGQASAAINGLLPGALDQAYTGVRAAAPEAHVAITGYPRLFSPEYGDYTGVVDFPPFGLVPFEVTVAEQEAMNALADALNGVVADRAAAHGFQYVDVTSRFEGHGVNSPRNWIGTMDSSGPLHPTERGQHAYGVALRSQLNPNDLR